MRIGGQSLAVGAKVQVIANSALVAHANNGRAPVVHAQWAVAIDPSMNLFGEDGIANTLVDGDEPMRRVRLVGRLIAGRAKVPVWAGQALVADTVNTLHRSVSIDTRYRKISLPCHSDRK